MNPVEDRLREALAARAAQSPVDPDAWSRTVTRSRHRVFPWRWPAWAVRLAPAAAVVAVAGVVISAVTLGQSIGQSALPAGPAKPHPSPSVPSMASVVRQIPPVTPFVPITSRADGHQVRMTLWFGHVPGYASAGLVLCQYDRGGSDEGFSNCAAAQLPAGTLARSVQDDISGWIRLGVAAPQVTSVTARLPGGKTVQGTVRSVRGVPDKVWAVSYPPADQATLVFRDAAGHEVTHLSTPGPSTTPRRPSQGGIPLFHDGNGTVTAYHISDDRIGFWAKDGSSWSDIPLSQSRLAWNGMAPVNSDKMDLFGYAPTGTARVVMRLTDGRRLTSSRIIAGWPGTGIVFWGPVRMPPDTGFGYDTILITYNRAGHVLRAVPVLFLQ